MDHRQWSNRSLKSWTNLCGTRQRSGQEPTQIAKYGCLYRKPQAELECHFCQVCKEGKYWNLRAILPTRPSFLSSTHPQFMCEQTCASELLLGPLPGLIKRSKAYSFPMAACLSKNRAHFVSNTEISEYCWKFDCQSPAGSNFDASWQFLL